MQKTKCNSIKNGLHGTEISYTRQISHTRAHKNNKYSVAYYYFLRQTESVDLTTFPTIRLIHLDKQGTIYRVFTGNCGKVTYYIFSIITHTFLKFVYLDYHSWTYITTNFHYHSRSFHIRNSFQKKSDILTPTKHLDCSQIWRIQKANCFKKGIL